MKDTVIISTISKIHSALISFLSFIILSLLFGFIVLQNGLYLEDFSISNINIKKLYLKWDEKLNLYVDDLSITHNNSTSQNDITKKELTHYTKNIYNIFTLFDSITITHFKYGEFEGKLSYKPSQDFQVFLNSRESDLKASVSIKKTFTDIHIKQFQSNKLNINGHIYCNLTNLENFSKLNISINNDANVTLYTIGDLEQIKYKAIAHNTIKDIKAILRDIPLPKETHYWIFDAIELNNLQISKIDGTFVFNEVQNAYKKLHVLASANKLHYTYNPKLDAIHTDHTDLEFKEGVLYIRPKQAHSYNFDLDKSWLKIDFTPPQEILTLFLQFSPILNDNMLHILKTYKINVPVKQNTGRVKTNLKLAVNLHTIDVDAKGDFFTQTGNFNYLGQDIDVKKLHLKLDNYKILVENMSANYKNIAAAKVDIKYNAKDSQGEVNLQFNDINYENLFKLRQKPLYATYYINKEQDILSIKNSSWLYSKRVIDIDKIDIPFDLKTLQLNIPTTYLNVQNTASGFCSGIVDLKKEAAKIDIDLLSFRYNGIKSTQSNIPLTLEYKENIFTLKSLDDIYADLVNSELKVSNLSAKLEDDIIYVKIPFISFGKFTQTKIYTKYDLKNKKASFNLNDLKITNPKTNETLYENKNILLNATINEDAINILSKELDAKFHLDFNRWSLKLNNLEKLYTQSPFLKKYYIDNGELEIYKKIDDETTKFRAKTKYQLPLLDNNGETIKQYNISGRLTKKQNLYIKINDTINISVKENLKINAQNINISLPKTVQLITGFDTNQSENSNLNIDVRTSNSKIYVGQNRYALSESLKLQYQDNILTAQLKHLQGKAGFKLENQNFHLYGEGFSDKFMENLFVFSKFKEGTFDFNVDGTLEHYKGTLLIQNSRLLDYTVLNNVLAFVNTVPSLVTFSVPGYSKNGLYMNHAYLKFDYIDNVYNVNEMYMDSKELKISAQGKASLKNDSIDMTMNLKTDIASDISKIPVVGYIIFDGKAISTTVKINGKLSDPTIKSGVAKEVIVAPFNIIKRTLKLPFKIFE